MISAITQLHESNKLIGFAQGILGRILLWAVAILLLWWHQSSVLMLAALTLVMLFPARKRTFLSLAALGIILGFNVSVSSLAAGTPARFNGLELVTNVAMMIVVLFGVFLLALQFKNWPALLRKFPVLTLHLLLWMLLLLSSFPALAFLIQLDFVAWRLSYMVLLASRGKIEGTTFRDHLFYLVPVFGGDNTPFGKGLDFLSRHEAADSEAFAKSQLAGIKLLILAVFWTYVLEFMNAVIFGMKDYWLTGWTLNMPTLTEMVIDEGSRSWPLGWLVIYLELIRNVLNLAIIGHVIVGCLRLLGFNVFRNTYKPLLSESVVEFWNRYYFYFKELLVEFFFYPTYLRARSVGPRTRMLLAVFAAAGLGNLYFHILALPELALNAGFYAFVDYWSARAVYCVLLALGIWVSMLRQQKSRQQGVSSSGLARFRRIAGVWTFYGLIHVWSLRIDGHFIMERLGFTLSLLGL
jgi:hypothetical protein